MNVGQTPTAYVPYCWVGPASQAKQAARPEPTAWGVGEEDDDTTASRSAAASGMGDGRAGGGSNRPAWLQQYDLVGKIGEGTYGLVFLARLKPPHPAPGRRGPPIAIKKFKQSKEGDGISPTAIREIMVRVSSCFACFLYPLPLLGTICDNQTLTPTLTAPTRDQPRERHQARQCPYQPRRHVTLPRIRLHRARPLCLLSCAQLLSPFLNCCTFFIYILPFVLFKKIKNLS
jgi:hypothetical protein